MFGLDPFSLPVAIIEIIFLLVVAALIGWLLSRLVLAGRVNRLRTALIDSQAELERCRQSKLTATETVAAKPEQVAEVLPPFVQADPLVPAYTNDVTPERIEAVAPASDSVVSDTPVQPDTAATAGGERPDNSEVAVLNRIAARANEVNFDRIGRATATEADDLKDIVGVGPFLERKLHSLGIYTFRQIANFAKGDIDKVNELIEFFPGRIERDNWVEQAKTFYERKQRKAN